MMFVFSPSSFSAGGERLKRRLLIEKPAHAQSGERTSRPRLTLTPLVCWLLGALLAGCGGQPAAQPAPVGDVAAGEALFKQTTIDSAPGLCARPQRGLG